MPVFNKVVVFDLDDTLYKEINFLKSAYRDIASYLDIESSEKLYKDMLFNYYQGKNVFEILSQRYDVKLSLLLEMYRSHKPQISLNKNVLDFLEELKFQSVKIGIITDGRSITQRNKIIALGLDAVVDDIVISEEYGYSKPHENVYRFYMDKYPKCQYYYIGDNIKKDFVTANRLGWYTFGIKDNGVNIHSQSLDVSSEFLPNQGFLDSIINIKI